MTLKVHEKWQWLARDARGENEWWFHALEPTDDGREWTSDGPCETFSSEVFDLPDLPPAKSLHRRIGDDWFPVDEVAGHVPGVTAGDDIIARLTKLEDEVESLMSERVNRAHSKNP